MLSSILLASWVFGMALASPLKRGLQAHESRAKPPGGYTLTGPAPSDTLLSLRLALVQNDAAGLVDTLYDVSIPSSTNYGGYLSKEEVEAFIAPTADSVSAVNAWLSDNGISSSTISPTGDWLLIQVPVSKADDLLDAQFSVFTHAATNKQTIRTLAYSIPTDLVGHLDLVHPTVSFPNPYGHPPVVYSPQVESTRSDYAASQCNISAITPACLQYLYSLPTTPATHGSALAVTGYVGQWPQRADLATFLGEYRADISPSTTYNLVSLNGGIDPQNGSAGIEANLDIQYTVGLATDVPVTFISVGGSSDDTDFTDELLDTALYMIGLGSPPQVMTTSYGVDEYLISEKLAYNLCGTYAQLGARGVSILFASGDGGVSGGHYPADGCTTFIPTFPSGCPYVTSVGGTINIPQTAVNFSGGGFSNYWARPSFQSVAVPAYLALYGSKPMDAGLYNASGRGIPDVAAYAVDFDVVLDGATEPVSGTSCASPTFATTIALANDALLAAGRPVLGWLNPWLYAEGWQGLTDITTGNNFACSDFTTGFEAAVGWDPVTGLGTPDYAALLRILGL
ncbi:family S53 protease-like protein [Daedalea quercina L-15889]|uniref:Family S53 protease-like protein n=1 Tax=Daedalea quercina L-15889 TaxID=1314783 RepID=A0A165SC81_9APHY|nr:family S53 protease-like protein [Daedalea quercina L-15889]